MYTDLQKAKKPVCFDIEIPLAKDSFAPQSKIYTVPESVCYQEFAPSRNIDTGHSVYAVNVNFVSMCITPILDGIVGIGGLKALECKLELILAPSSNGGARYVLRRILPCRIL